MELATGRMGAIAVALPGVNGGAASSEDAMREEGQPRNAEHAEAGADRRIDEHEAEADD